jgi:hypothetical protein
MSGDVTPVAWERRSSGGDIYRPSLRHLRYTWHTGTGAPRALCGTRIYPRALQPVWWPGPMPLVLPLSAAETAARPPCPRCYAKAGM